ncbi:MAG: MMPL family transporter [Desulfuromonadaceae bacterium]|nr:MMPL family transporter [Desulfuromonadaceae bacterium]
MQLAGRLYQRLQAKRGWLLLFLILGVALALYNLRTLKVEENIAAMLPDGGSTVARDFALLQQAPFARKVAIHVQLCSGVAAATDEHVLAHATSELCAALPSPLFLNPVSGPAQLGGMGMLRELGIYLPRLATSEDLTQVEQRLQRPQMEHYLVRAVEQLLQPQGIMLKQQVQQDPLALDTLALAKMQHLNPIPRVAVRQGHFFSRDGRSTLILVDTKVEITDSAGARQLEQAFMQACSVLPPEVKADMVSAHAYTLANARVIEADVQRVLLFSALGILLVFALVLRSLRALAVYLLPLLAMLGATQITAGVFGTISGITLGFGAVLLGITIDFALHVYFALRHGDDPVFIRLQAVARPVSFGAFTTMAAFALLLSSDLPGQRQLAVFAISGIGLALLLALVVLPHFIIPLRAPLAGAPREKSARLNRPWMRAGVMVFWFAGMVAGAWQVPNLHINGSLRQLSYMPPELLDAEQRLAHNWGEMRGRALIFAAAPELELALQRNEQVWQVLHERGLSTGAVSVAPLLCSMHTQDAHLQRWESFWKLHLPTAKARLEQQAARHGFAPGAFAPFWERVHTQPPVLDTAQVRKWGLGQMLDALILEDVATDAPGYKVLTLVPDSPEIVALLAPVVEKMPGITLVSQSRFGIQLADVIGTDFKRFILGAGMAVLLLLVVLFRRPLRVLLALVPVVTGLVAMYGGMGWLGLELNLFNIVTSILIIGLGVDYGIFMVCQGQEHTNLATTRAIVLSGITTLIGFGVLVLAQHPALHSIGITVVLGISAAVPAAVLVIPALQGGTMPITKGTRCTR